MMSTRSTVCALALLAFGVGTAQAQSATTRAEAKAEGVAKAASTPLGQRSTPNQDKGPMQRGSDTTRAAVKAEAAAQPAAAKKGDERSLPRQDQGGGATVPGTNAGMMKPGVETRAEAHSEAASSVKPGSDKPHGESSKKGQSKGQSQ